MRHVCACIFVEVFNSGLCHKNEVKFVFANASGSMSRLGSNLKHILVQCNIRSDAQFITNDVCSILQKKWINSCNENDIRICNQICEPITERDSIVPGAFTASELKDMIEFLCIS